MVQGNFMSVSGVAIALLLSATGACAFRSQAIETFAVAGSGATHEAATTNVAGAGGRSGANAGAVSPPPAATQPVAGASPRVDPQQKSAEDTACALEFSACLLANPAGYAECARINAEHCTLLGGSAPLPGPDAGLPPSAACALQQADCIMRMPDRTSDCMKLFEMCRL